MFRSGLLTLQRLSGIGLHGVSPTRFLLYLPFDVPPPGSLFFPCLFCLFDLHDVISYSVNLVLCTYPSDNRYSWNSSDMFL